MRFRSSSTRQLLITLSLPVCEGHSEMTIFPMASPDDSRRYASAASSKGWMPTHDPSSVEWRAFADNVLYMRTDGVGPPRPTSPDRKDAVPCALD